MHSLSDAYQQSVITASKVIKNPRSQPLFEARIRSATRELSGGASNAGMPYNRLLR
jgi:hypothetical protein